MKRPRSRLPPGQERTVSPDIAQCLFAQSFESKRSFERARLMVAIGGEALQLDRKARNVDAVANAVAFVRRMGLLQKIGHILQDAVFGEGQIFLAGSETPRLVPGSR